jgi:hypothetical protein
MKSKKAIHIKKEKQYYDVSSFNPLDLELELCVSQLLIFHLFLFEYFN